MFLVHNRRNWRGDSNSPFYFLISNIHSVENQIMTSSSTHQPGEAEILDKTRMEIIGMASLELAVIDECVDTFTRRRSIHCRHVRDLSLKRDLTEPNYRGVTEILNLFRLL